MRLQASSQPMDQKAGHDESALVLARHALHEIYAAPADGAAALGFALGAAAQTRAPLLWVGADFGAAEQGALYAAGLWEFGLDPAAFILARARNETQVLQAALEGARSAGLGAVLVELWGAARGFDLTASRRLALSAEASGVQTLVLRLGASAPAPSAARTRWRIVSAPSALLAAHAPGAPAFVAHLERRRDGGAPQIFHVEWDREQRRFRSADVKQRAGARSSAAVSWPVVSLSERGALYAGPWAQAG